MQAHQSEKIQDGVPFIAVDRQRFCQKCRFVVIFAGAHEEISDFRMFRIQLPDDPVSQVEAGGKLIQQPFFARQMRKIESFSIEIPQVCRDGAAVLIQHDPAEIPAESDQFLINSPYAVVLRGACRIFRKLFGIKLFKLAECLLAVNRQNPDSLFGQGVPQPAEFFAVLVGKRREPVVEAPERRHIQHPVRRDAEPLESASGFHSRSVQLIEALHIHFSVSGGRVKEILRDSVFAATGVFPENMRQNPFPLRIFFQQLQAVQRQFAAPVPVGSLVNRHLESPRNPSKQTRSVWNMS